MIARNWLSDPAQPTQAKMAFNLILPLWAVDYWVMHAQYFSLISRNLKLQFCFKASFSLPLILLGVHLSYEWDPLTPNIVTKLQMLAESRCVVMFCEDTVNSFWRTKVLFSSSDTATAAPILGTEYYSRNYLTCRFPNFNSDVTEFCWNSSFMNGFVQFSLSSEEL